MTSSVFFCSTGLLLASDGVDYEAINVTVMFPALSEQGAILCTPVRIFDSRAFQKTRVFSVNLVILESDIAIQDHVPSAQVLITNIDST
jgi:hypothetical protein